MAERIRRADEAKAAHRPLIQEHVPVRSGIDGYADSMGMFPRLKEWENQIALQALREGRTVDDLRAVTPFSQYLGVAKRAQEAGEETPFHSFATLFDYSPSIDLLVSFGNFHTIRTWTRTFSRQFSKFHLPLEKFYQAALYKIVPYQARSYDPCYGRSFTSFMTRMLEKRFRTFAKQHIQEISAPTSYEDKPQSKKGRPAQGRERAFLVSLDDPEPQSDMPLSLAEHLEHTYMQQKTQPHVMIVKQGIKYIYCLVLPDSIANKKKLLLHSTCMEGVPHCFLTCGVQQSAVSGISGRSCLRKYMS